jgi:hypothetical protein
VGHPVVSGGRLYLREQDKVMCYHSSDAADQAGCSLGFVRNSTRLVHSSPAVRPAR